MIIKNENKRKSIHETNQLWNRKDNELTKHKNITKIIIESRW